MRADKKAEVLNTQELFAQRANKNTTNMEQVGPVPRMRTIHKCHAELKKLDPDTSVTEHAIRALVKQGSIPVVHAGNKVLINFDEFIRILAWMGTAAGRNEESQDIVPIPENLAERRSV